MTQPLSIYFLVVIYTFGEFPKLQTEAVRLLDLAKNKQTLLEILLK